MALSPARRHQLRVRAAHEAAGRGPGELMDGAGPYEQLMMQLQNDRLRLKSLQSAEAKAQLKTSLITQYDDYVAGVLAGGQGAEDALLTEMLVWNLDIGRYPQAFEIAAYALQHGLSMPDRFARTTGCLVAEEVAEAALSSQRAGAPLDLEIIDQAIALTDGQDMPDEVRAKLQLAAGRGRMLEIDRDNPDVDQLEAAIAHLKRAIELHKSCGGKKDLESAERLLKKQAPEKG